MNDTITGLYDLDEIIELTRAPRTDLVRLIRAGRIWYSMDGDGTIYLHPRDVSRLTKWATERREHQRRRNEVRKRRRRERRATESGGTNVK